MNLHRLRHFETLYRLGNFARSADELGLTQSALSRSIQKLEDEFGAVLFDRTTHYVHATVDADRLIRATRDVITASTNLEQEARGLAHPGGGTVKIGSGPYPLQPLISDTIARFSGDHPAVRITVTGGTSDQLLASLVDRQLDLVICNRAKFVSSGHADDILCIPLQSEPLVIVCRADHPLALGEGDSADWPWALPRPAPDSNFPRAIRARFTAGRFPDYELDSTAACLDLVRQGRVITVVPRSLAARACRDGILTALPLPASEATRDAVHLLRNRSRGALVSAFVATLKDVAGANAQSDGIAVNSAASDEPTR